MTSIYPSSTTSSSSSTSSANLLRISGMASGIDTDSVVKSMVSNYQTKIDKANQAKQTLQWKQDAYRDIIKDIKGLQDYFDPISSKYILSQNTFNTNSVSNTKDTIASVTASSSAKAGTYTVNVQQLAEQAKVTGSSKNSIVKVTDGSEWSGAKLTIDGTTITLDSITNSNGDGTTLDEVVANINSKISAATALNGKVSASLNNGKIEFKNISPIELSATDSSNSQLISNTSIVSGASDYYSGDMSKWEGAHLTIGNTTIDLDNSIADSNLSGTLDVDDVVDNINSKISGESTLNGKILASKTADGKIEFKNVSPIELSAKDSSGSQLIPNDNSIVAGSLYSYNEDISEWNGANLTINGTIIQLNASITDSNGNGTTLDEVAANINTEISKQSALSGKVSASYVKDGNNTYIKFTSTSSIDLTAKTSDNSKTLSSITINSGISSSTKLSELGIVSGNDLSFKLSYDSTTTTTPITITATSTETLQNLMDKVNSATSGAVTMSIDSTTGEISFQSKNYGSTSKLTIADNGNLSALGVTAGSYFGKDSIVDITEPGQSTSTTTTQSSNNFTVNGVTYSLVDIGKTTSTVTANSDTVVSNIKKFIDDYNSVISKINTKLTEKKNSDYSPLTDAQKESMSESQITAWETKAKVGILRNDDYLNSLLTQLRGAFSSPVYSSYTDSSTNTRMSLNFGNYGPDAIGIDTSSTNHTDGGQIYIKDQAKLKSAIENNIDNFKKLFIGESSDTLSDTQSYIGSTKYMKDGIFTRIDSILENNVAAPGIGEDGTYTLLGTMNIFVNKQYDSSILGTSSKNTLPDQMYSKTLSINKLKTQMSDAETRYYKKFTALETAMNTLNSQQSQLSSMLGTA